MKKIFLLGQSIFKYRWARFQNWPRFGQKGDEAKMVAGIVLSTWLGVWIFGKIFSILRDCFKLSLVLLLILAYFFYSPDALASVNGFVNN